MEPSWTDRPLRIQDLVSALVGWWGDDDLPSWAAWPPPSPPPRDSADGIAHYVEAPGLDEERYQQVCAFAEELIQEESFQEAVRLVAPGLVVAPSLDFDALEILREAAGRRAGARPTDRSGDMQHVSMKATATDIHQGVGHVRGCPFGRTEDRERDTILPTAFDRTIEAWQRSGKNLPLLHEHTTTVVGAMFPDSVQATEKGLVVAGEVDRSTDEGSRSGESRTTGSGITPRWR